MGGLGPGGGLGLLVILFLGLLSSARGETEREDKSGSGEMLLYSIILLGESSSDDILELIVLKGLVLAFGGVTTASML